MKTVRTKNTAEELVTARKATLYQEFKHYLSSEMTQALLNVTTNFITVVR